MTTPVQNIAIQNATAPDASANVSEVDDATVALLKKASDDFDAKVVSATHSAQPSTPSGWWSTHNAMTMSSAVLIFGLAVIVIAAFTGKRQATVEESLRMYGTIMVITMAVFLVVAGYDDKQIAAPLGLLGTIVGYLLGRTTKADPPKP